MGLVSSERCPCLGPSGCHLGLALPRDLRGFILFLTRARLAPKFSGVMEEKQLLTGQRNDLAFRFLLLFCFKTGSHVVQVDLELLSSGLNLSKGGLIGVLHHAQS